MLLPLVCEAQFTELFDMFCLLAGSRISCPKSFQRLRACFTLDMPAWLLTLFCLSLVPGASMPER